MTNQLTMGCVEVWGVKEDLLRGRARRMGGVGGTELWEGLG